MKTKMSFILPFLLAWLFTNIPLLMQAQISIPYGNDVLYIDHSSSRFNLQGNSWPCRHRTYFFLNGTDDISGDGEQDAVRRALTTWSNATNIDFIETCTESEADIRIGWFVGIHGDICPNPLISCDFDGLGGVLAHAYPPPPIANVGEFVGDVHFDDAESWRTDGHDDDLESVALHELGHALGLLHTTVSGAVMASVYEGVRRSLTQDDIDGIRSIYGQRVNPIVGDDITCENITSIFSVCDNLHAGYTYQWTVPYGISITSGQGTHQIHVEKVNDNCGRGDVTVTISADCHQITYKRLLQYCCQTPHVPYDVYIQYDKMCCYNFIIIPYYPSYCYTQFHWRVNAVDYYTDTNILGCFDPRITHYYSIGVSVINECGESSALYDYIIAQPWPETYYNCLSPPEVIEISPNPTSSELNVNLDNKSVGEDELLKVTIYNWSGKEVQSTDEHGTSFRLFTSDLPTGQYYIGIKSYSGFLTEKFVIIH